MTDDNGPIQTINYIFNKINDPEYWLYLLNETNYYHDNSNKRYNVICYIISNNYSKLLRIFLKLFNQKKYWTLMFIENIGYENVCYFI